MRKWAALLAFLLTAAALWTYQDSLYAWLREDPGSWNGELLVIGAALLIALVPAIPYSAVAVLLGAKYGAAAGSLINLCVSVAAAAALFAVVRGSLTAEQRRKAAGMRGVSRLTRWFERDPFAAVLFARMIPFLPAQGVNLYTGLTRMGWAPYLGATVMGKLPYLLAVTVLGDQLMSSGWRNTALTAGAYAAFLVLAVLVYRCIRGRRGENVGFAERKAE